MRLADCVVVKKFRGAAFNLWPDIHEGSLQKMDPAGRGTTQAGKICGMIGTILLILGLIVFGIIFMFGFAAALAQHH